MLKWLWGYAVAVVTVGAVIVVQNIWDLNKSDWASWAQAIGTVAAVAGALWVARYQAIQDRKREEDRDVRDRLAAYQLLLSIAWRLNSATEALAHHLRAGGHFELYQYRCKRRDEFEHIRTAARELPVHKLPDFGAVSYLLDMRKLADETLNHAQAFVEEQYADVSIWFGLCDKTDSLHFSVAETIKEIRLGLL